VLAPDEPAGVLRHYEVPPAEAADTARFLSGYPEAAAAPGEAVPYLRRGCGESPVRLDVHEGPENGCETLFGMIPLDMSPLWALSPERCFAGGRAIEAWTGSIANRLRKQFRPE